MIALSPKQAFEGKENQEGYMQFISDIDKEKLIEVRSRIGLVMDRNGKLSSTHQEASISYDLVSEVLESIERLGHPAPHQEPKIGGE